MVNNVPLEIVTATPAAIDPDNYTFSVLLAEGHGSIDPGHINVMVTDKSAGQTLSHHFGMVGSDVAEVSTSLKSMNNSMVAAGALVPAVATYAALTLSGSHEAILASGTFASAALGMVLGPVLGKNSVLNELPSGESSQSHSQNSLVTLKDVDEGKPAATFQRQDYNISHETYKSLVSRIQATDQNFRPYSIGLRNCITVSKDLCKIAGVESGRAALNTPSGWFETLVPQEPGIVLANSSDTTQTMLGKVLDVGGGALKVVGKALPVVGGLVVGAEVLGLSSEAHAAFESGDITKGEFAALEGIYGAHIAQGAADPTGFGGEIPIQIAYAELSENWAPELQNSLRPSSLADLLRGEEQIRELTKFEIVLEGLDGESINLSPEAQGLSELYNDVVVAEHHYETVRLQVGTLGGNKMQALMEAEAQMESAYADYEANYDALEEKGKINTIIAELNGNDTQYAGDPVILQEFGMGDDAQINSDLLKQTSDPAAVIGNSAQLSSPSV